MQTEVLLWVFLPDHEIRHQDRIMRSQALLTVLKANRWHALILAATVTSGAIAQSTPANPAKQAIDNRKAVFTLIGNNFRPVGEILRGNRKYDSAEVAKYASRVSFLATLVGEAFPEVSKTGDTQAKSEIWSDRAAFDKRVKDFQDHALVLSQLVAQGGSDSEPFKNAARAVAQDCKGCHDNYRSR